jgi:RHS repeat-associated protein
LDKVLSVTENGKPIASFNYHNDGQIAQAIHNGKSEDFLWDGLALIHRGETSFINEPYVTGGNPILSSKDGVMFNDMLGSTLNIGGKAFNMTAFGESPDSNAMYTGKPYIGELGYAFLFRNYRSDCGKWQTTDPLGYPDGWNNLAYCNNGVTMATDPYGTETWVADGVRYISSASITNIYGIVTDNGWSGVFGSSVLVIWEYKIHGICLKCNGPNCSTGECYYTYSIAQTISNTNWQAAKPYWTPVLSGADVIAGAINLLVDYLTGNYWPIAIEKVDENNRNNITNASPPPVKKNNFLGKHCE